jgi:hypothetical protein
MDVLKFCERNGIELGVKAAVAASESGNLDVLKFVMKSALKSSTMYELETCAGYSAVWRAACRGGKADCLKYGLDLGCFFFCNFTSDAISGGHLDCLKVLYNKSMGSVIDKSNRSCNMAATNGHLDCLKFLRSIGCKWDSSTCNAAASNGHLACLEYACNEGCPRDDNTCTAAARGGHIECIKFLKDKCCFWNEETCAAAASGGHIAVLKWLIDNGCPCDPVVSDAIDKVKPDHPAKKMKVEA